MKQLVYLLIFTFIFFSCDRLSRGVKIVQNQSSKDIKVRQIFIQQGNKEDTYFVKSGGQATIWELVSNSGTVLENKNSCVNSWANVIIIEVVNNTQLKITKDLNNSDNWTFSKSGLDGQCRTTITDADIVLK